MVGEPRVYYGSVSVAAVSYATVTVKAAAGEKVKISALGLGIVTGTTGTRIGAKVQGADYNASFVLASDTSPAVRTSCECYIDDTIGVDIWALNADSASKYMYYGLNGVKIN